MTKIWRGFVMCKSTFESVEDSCWRNNHFATCISNIGEEKFPLEHNRQPSKNCSHLSCHHHMQQSNFRCLVSIVLISMLNLHGCIFFVLKGTESEAISCDDYCGHAIHADSTLTRGLLLFCWVTYISLEGMWSIWICGLALFCWLSYMMF